MIKEHAIEEDPHGLFLARDSVDIGKILAKHGSPDDIYDIQQGFIPHGPLITTLAGGIGFTVALIQKTPTSLALSLCFLFIAAVGLYRTLVQSRYKETTVRRSQLMQIAEAAAELRKSKNDHH